MVSPLQYTNYSAMANPLIQVLALKIDQDAALIEDMLILIPLGKQDWRPDWPATDNEPPYNTTRLAAHLVESWAGLCACFHRLHPQTLAHFNVLKTQLSQHQNPTLAESLALLSTCRAHAAEGFALTTDAQLSQLIPTYFSPQGEALLSVLLQNSNHIKHHAYQLFLYLKLLGLPVSTRHLYHFESKPE